MLLQYLVKIEVGELKKDIKSVPLSCKVFSFYLYYCDQSEWLLL